MPPTIVVTPTIGTKDLKRCIESVQSQRLVGVEHLLVVDGPQYLGNVNEIKNACALDDIPVHVMVLPFNVGEGGWCGHRVYAAIPFLLNFDYVAYLDEDNWYDPEHLELMHQAMLDEKADWAYSLRKIFDASQTFITNDDCESLGHLCHTCISSSDFLVDTSCYLFKLSVAKAVSPHWMHRAKQRGEIEADRAVVRFLLQHPSFKGACSRAYTMNYTAYHGPGQLSFFRVGNALTRYDFGTKSNVYLFHLNSTCTEACVQSLYKDDQSYALDERMFTLVRGLRARFNVINGYSMAPVLPSKSIVLVILNRPNDVPDEVLTRRDVKKIVLTIRSPRACRRLQWSSSFLKTRFDHILTPWTPLLQHSNALYCASTERCLDFENPLDTRLLHTPSHAVGRDVVMVQECLRGKQEETYLIDGVTVKSLDHLRELYVESLKDITVYGLGWDRSSRNPLIKVGNTKHRSLDDKHAITILRDYTFNLIIEDTDAEGYVSEKIYDAFIAGCIPIYYGNTTDLPRDMYIDLRDFETSEALQTYLDCMTLEQIEAKRAFVLEHRHKVLRDRVSTKAFATAFETAILLQ